jgi:hypothetical protein
MKKLIVSSATLLLFAGFLGVGTAFAAPEAYIDPNTGGLIFQALLVVFTAISGVVFFFSSRIKMAFNRMMRSFRERNGETMVVEDVVEEMSAEEQGEAELQE